MTKAAGFAQPKRITKVPSMKTGKNPKRHSTSGPNSTSDMGTKGAALKPHKVPPTANLPQPKDMGMGHKQFLPKNW